MRLATYSPRRAAGRPRPPGAGGIAGPRTAAESGRVPVRPPDGQDRGHSAGARREDHAGRLVRRILWPAADVAAVAIAAAVAGVGPARGGAYGLLVLLALAVSGLHRLPVCLRATDQAGRLAVAAAVPGLLLAPWLSATRALLIAACTTGLLITLRAAACAALRSAYRHGRLVRRALIIGAGPGGLELARVLAEHPELGLTPCGVLADRPGEPGSAGPPRLGWVSDGPSTVVRHDVSHVFVDEAAATAALTGAVRAVRGLGIEVSVLPARPELGLRLPRNRMDEVWGIPVIQVRPDPQATARRTAKRATDLAIGTVLAVMAAPVAALLAVAVAIDLRLPPLFRQVRVVGPGRTATITKLRTLRPAGDPDTAWRISAGQSSALGRILRGTHVDELPQLSSVLRGEMSLVGPRPERPHFARGLAEVVPGYADRERVTAGLTGWAQVHGLSGDTSIADRARFDNFYIEYWSVWLDLLILARTIPAALSGALRSARGGTQ
jgi:lipopolysaccharide/colanic/teichoic acid biosynthesis glycosyltransferase